MDEVEKVKQTALAFLAAIREAQAAGYVVQWPSRPEGLPAIAVSATAAVVDHALAPGLTTDMPACLQELADEEPPVAAKPPRRPRK